MLKGRNPSGILLLVEEGERERIHVNVDSSTRSFSLVPPPAPPTGTSPEAVAEGLTKRTLAARGEVLTTNLNASAANYTRDAMAKVGGAHGWDSFCLVFGTCTYHQLHIVCVCVHESHLHHTHARVRAHTYTFATIL